MCLVVGAVLLVLAATASAEASFRVMLVLGGVLGLLLAAAFMVMLAWLEYSAGRLGR